jgi:hypothetical protein
MADLGAIGTGGTLGVGSVSTLPVSVAVALGYLPTSLLGAHIAPLLGPVETVYYPATLPRPSFTGYQLSPADQTVRTDVEVGTARQRRRTAARNDKVKLQWKLDDTQMKAFREWFDGPAEANGGASWFTGLELALGDGGIKPVEARFTGPWTAVPLPGMNWFVDATLEIR